MQKLKLLFIYSLLSFGLMSCGDGASPYGGFNKLFGKTDPQAEQAAEANKGKTELEASQSANPTQEAEDMSAKDY